MVHTYAVSALTGRKREDGKFEESLGLLVRSCLNNSIKEKKEKKKVSQ